MSRLKYIIFVALLVCAGSSRALVDFSDKIEQIEKTLDSNLIEQLEIAEKLRYRGFPDSANTFLKQIEDEFELNDTARFIFEIEYMQNITKQQKYEEALKHYDNLIALNKTLFYDNDTIKVELASYYDYITFFKNYNFTETESAVAATTERFRELNMENEKSYLISLFRWGTIASKAEALDKSDSIYVSLLDSYKNKFGLKSKEYADILNAIATIKIRMGQYETAMPYFTEALEILNGLDDKTNIIMHSVLNQLGYCYKFLGQYQIAESLYIASINYIKDNSFNELQLSTSLNNLSVLYYTIGEYSKVRPIIEQSLAIELKKNRNSPIVIALYINLGNLCYKLGQYNDALDYFSQSLEILNEVFEPGHIYYSKTYNSMGMTCILLKRYDEALEYLQKALTIREEQLGPNHPDVATILHNLGLAYKELGQDDKIESLLKRALAINEKALGKNHSSLAKNQLELAMYYLEHQTQLNQAESLMVEALRIRKEVYFAYHPEITETIKKLCYFYIKENDTENAYLYLNEMLNSRQEIANYIFSFSTEDQKLTWIKNNPVLFNILLSYAIDQTTNSKFRDLALEMVLEGKSIISSFVQNDKNLMYCSDDPELRNLHQTYISVCEAVAGLALSNKVKNAQDSLNVLIKQKETLEGELNRLCSNIFTEENNHHVELNLLADQLTGDDLLLEFVKYQPFDFSQFEQDSSKVENSYLVFTIDNNKDIAMFDLGSAAAIEELVVTIRDQIDQKNNMLYSPSGLIFEQKLNEQSSLLYDKIINPIKNKLNGKKNLYISTDGSLSLLPFEILPQDSNNDYFVDHFNCRYLNSGRDLLKFNDEKQSVKSLAIFANPSHPRLTTPLFASNLRSTRPENTFNSGDCLIDRNYSSLPYAQKEAKTIFDLSQKYGYKTKIYLKGDASETNLKNIANPPSVLHFATHGFYCPVDTGYYNILHMTLNSGLILAAAEDDSPLLRGELTNENDGILTALEVADLNLHNTYLVNLAACRTGVGDIISGEGVYGLRRAFQNAGAKALLLSMWNVPDDLSYRVMTDFYENWFNGKSKSVSLHDAILKSKALCRENYGNTHPALWAGFILIGNPY